MIFNLVAGMGRGGLPEFDYTGQYQLLDDGKDKGVQNWRIRFLSSGVLTFKKLKTSIDVFLVGGGGARGNAAGVWNKSGSGGGGYTKTYKSIVAYEDASYTITVGEGGKTPTKGGAVTQGESSKAFGYEAAGGMSGKAIHGGNGGSGGADCDGTTRAQDGADGEDTNDENKANAGKGQGPTTREFGEATGELYATGGAQGSGSGAPNTGDGAGGITEDDDGVASDGGSGIVVIRNAR